MSGQSDYLLRVVAKDAEDYERLHKETLSRLPGVTRIQTSIALRRVVRRQVAPPRPVRYAELGYEATSRRARRSDVQVRRNPGNASGLSGRLMK